MLGNRIRVRASVWKNFDIFLRNIDEVMIKMVYWGLMLREEAMKHY